MLHMKTIIWSQLTDKIAKEMKIKVSEVEKISQRVSKKRPIT